MKALYLLTFFSLSIVSTVSMAQRNTSKGNQGKVGKQNENRCKSFVKYQLYKRIINEVQLLPRQSTGMVDEAKANHFFASKAGKKSMDIMVKACVNHCSRPDGASCYGQAEVHKAFANALKPLLEDMAKELSSTGEATYKTIKSKAAVFHELQARTAQNGVKCNDYDIGNLYDILINNKQAAAQAIGSDKVYSPGFDYGAYLRKIDSFGSSTKSKKSKSGKNKQLETDRSKLILAAAQVLKLENYIPNAKTASLSGTDRRFKRRLRRKTPSLTKECMEGNRNLISRDSTKSCVCSHFSSCKNYLSSAIASMHKGTKDSWQTSSAAEKQRKTAYIEAFESNFSILTNQYREADLDTTSYSEDDLPRIYAVAMNACEKDGSWTGNKDAIKTIHDRLAKDALLDIGDTKVDENTTARLKRLSSLHSGHKSSCGGQEHSFENPYGTLVKFDTISKSIAQLKNLREAQNDPNAAKPTNRMFRNAYGPHAKLCKDQPLSLVFREDGKCRCVIPEDQPSCSIKDSKEDILAVKKIGTRKKITFGQCSDDTVNVYEIALKRNSKRKGEQRNCVFAEPDKRTISYVICPESDFFKGEESITKLGNSLEINRLLEDCGKGIRLPGTLEKKIRGRKETTDS